jgi:hypothetical protein
VGLRALWQIARGWRAALRREAGHHCGRGAGAVVAGPDGREKQIVGSGSRGCGRRELRRRERTGCALWRGSGNDVTRRGHQARPEVLERLCAPARPDSGVPNGGCRCDRHGGSGRAVQSQSDVLLLPESRGGVVWQRLRAAGVSARRSGGTLGMAHREPVARRHRRRPVHAGAAVHHGDLHRLCVERSDGCVAGHRGHLSASFPLRGLEQPFSPEAARFADGWSVSRWRKRRFARVDGRGDVSTRRGGPDRLADDRDGHRRGRAVVALADQLSVAGPGRYGGGFPQTILSTGDFRVARVAPPWFNPGAT